MKRLVTLLMIIVSLPLFSQIQYPPYISCDGDVVRAGTVENHNELIFSSQPGNSRLLLVQPTSELHIWNKFILEDVPDAAILFGETGDRALDSLTAKIIFHNCVDYFDPGQWVNPDTGEVGGELHFDGGYGDTGDLYVATGQIEIIFDCETLSTTPSPTIDELSDRDLYDYDCITYNIKGQRLYQGKFEGMFYNGDIASQFTNQIIFIQIIPKTSYQSKTVLKRIYKR